MLSTPTDNHSLPMRRAGFPTLTAALDYAAGGQTGINFWTARGELTEALPYAELRRRALVLARRLAGIGLPRASRLLLVADTWPGFAVAFFAAQYAGLLPVPVSVPAGLGGKQAFVEQLRRQLEASGARLALAPTEMKDFLAEAAQGHALDLCGDMAAFDALPETTGELQPFTADEGCYIQFSSGSTRFPLGVAIDQSMLCANITGTSHFGLDVGPQDRAVSWLPWYHDMGLIGFLLVPLSNQRSVDFLSPRDFARRPLQWLKLISQQRATATYSPSFGYDLVSRRVQPQQLAELDLSCLRIAGIGADMIQVGVLRRFAETYAKSGFRPEAFLPSYGMAETCVALSFSAIGAGARVDSVDRQALGTRSQAIPVPAAGNADSRELVLCGRAMPQHRIEVRDSDGRPLADRQVGRIYAHGPSVMQGYFDQPDASRAVLSADGWLDTGDLGYLLDGQIVITGRAKDLIIVNGRNIWPQDIEWAVEAMPQFRRGDAAAFALENDRGPEQIVVLAIARESDPVRRDSLARDVAGVVKETVGVDPLVRLVSPAIGLPQTSSGKLSRSRAKASYLSGAYPP